MMNSLWNKKGFTLIEVLIVVVIIGILASLILPRMLAQPERVMTAEAMNYFGVIARAFEAASSPGTIVFTAADSGAPGGAANPAWRALGLDNLPGNAHFQYACTPPADPDGVPNNADDVAPQCAATRVGGDKNAGTMTMDMATRRIVACDQVIYVLANAGTDRATCV